VTEVGLRDELARADIGGRRYRLIVAELWGVIGAIPDPGFRPVLVQTTMSSWMSDIRSWAFEEFASIVSYLGIRSRLTSDDLGSGLCEQTPSG
jgi:hypothetical protein